MPTSTTSSRTEREDPRVTRSKARILRAALEVIGERGYEGATIEGIAERAGAGKSTVYRHWDSKAALFIAALELVRPDASWPDTGSLRDDVLTVVLGTTEVLRTDRSRYLAILIDAAERDPELVPLHQAWVQARREPLYAAFAAATQRGELPPGVDAAAAVDLIIGPILARRFLSRGPLTREFAEEVVDLVLDRLRERA